MGRRHCRLFLLWALLCLLRPGVLEAQSEQRTYENVKLLQISMHPTASVQISSDEEENLENQDGSKSEEAKAKEEEKTLKDLVDVLEDMVKDIPTAKAELPQHTVPLPTKPPVVMTTNLAPLETGPKTVDTVWVSLKPTPQEKQAEVSETVAVASNISPASPTAVWEIQNSTSESIVQQTDETTTVKPVVSVSLLIQKATTKKKIKNFDQETNGAFSNLVQSLENVQKLNGVPDTFTNKPVDQETEDGQVHKKKPAADGILESIEKLIETFKNIPPFVKEDRNLSKYVQTAETYIKEALELTKKAEKQLREESRALPLEPPPAQEKEISLAPMPELLPEPTVTVQSISLPPAPLAKKADDPEVEMGKLKAFIDLLYGFSPHLAAYTQDTAHKKVAEDITERALAVFHAIKNIFCGSEEAQSKQALKQLLKEDMEHVSQAMKAKRAT